MLVVVATGHETGEAHWRAEAVRWHGEAKRLGAENKALRAKVTALSEKVATLAKLVFGRSSERKSPASPAHEDVAPGTQDGSRRRRGQQPGSHGHRRRDYSGLETVEEIHDVGEQERVCPDCGAAYAPFGQETSEQVDWQVRIVRVIHRRPTYRRTCRCPVPGVLAAPVPPKPIRKGMFTAEFLARLLVEKYVLGRPLERVVAMLEADGLCVAKGTLVGSLRALSDLLAPLDQGIRARNAHSAHLHVDETSWRVFEQVAGKANNRWWLWVFVAPDTTVFLIDPTRSTKVVEAHLGIEVEQGCLQDGRRLLVSSDFFTVYQCLATIEGVDPLWCWAHIRRYFIRAADAHKELKGWAAAWLERIGALYVAHRTLAAVQAGSAEHDEATADLAHALGQIDVMRQQEAADVSLHPGAGKVLATLDHEWEGLIRHQEFPELPLDNNAAERALRGPVVLRKNCYGSGSAWAATLAARVWTITTTAKRAGLNPLAYLIAYLDACASAGGRPPTGRALDRFLPWAVSEADLAAWSNPAPGPAP